jgi:hypothetical protein
MLELKIKRNKHLMTSLITWMMIQNSMALLIPWELIWFKLDQLLKEN